MLKRWVIVAVCCLITALSFSACSTVTGQTGESAGDKIHVSASFNAIKEFVEAVGGDRVEVSTIIPDGMEAHDFEPKAQDLVNLSTASIFVYNGLGMEEWAEEAIQATGNDSLTVVNASEGADIIERETDDEEHHEDADHEEDADHKEEGHSHGKYDPHLWLSLKGAQTEAANIKDALIKVDPDHKEYYEENYNIFAAELDILYNEYSEKFQSVAKNTFVTGHAAFGYLCRDFGLQQNSVSDIYAEGEPSAQQLAALVEYCRQNDVTTVFAEEMASPEVSQTLANEVGAEVQTIYTMETGEDGKTYLERMTDNLEKIYNSLT